MAQRASEREKNREETDLGVKAEKGPEESMDQEGMEMDNCPQGKEAGTDYRAAFEREHLRNASLAGRVADLEARCAQLEFKLNRIKGNPIWKMSAPLRRCMHFFLRQRDRLAQAICRDMLKSLGILRLS